MPGANFWRIIMDMPCDDQPFHNAACTQVIQDFCTNTPPPPFYLPNLVGRDVLRGDLLSEQQLTHFVAYQMCTYGLGAGSARQDVEWVCSSEPSTWGIVFEQITPVGTTGRFASTGIQVKAWQECVPPTTCVLVVESSAVSTSSPPSSVWYCH